MIKTNLVVAVLLKEGLPIRSHLITGDIEAREMEVGNLVLKEYVNHGVNQGDHGSIPEDWQTERVTDTYWKIAPGWCVVITRTSDPS